MAKQIFYSVRRRDFMYLQGIEPNENYKAGAKAPTMGTPHISADYRSIWGKEERMFEPLTLASYIKIILEEYRWEDRLPDDLAILCHVDKRYFWDEPPEEEAKNFCGDCHWHESEEQYCFRKGCHAYDESSCEYWEPMPADEPIPAPGGKTVPTTYDLLYEEGGCTSNGV